MDGIYTKDDKGKEIYQERPKKDIEAIEELVRKSAGFNAARGDQVVVSSMPFSKMEDNTLSGTDWQTMFRTLLPLVKYVVLLAAFVMVFLWVVRPLIRGTLSALPSQPVMMGEVMKKATAPAALGVSEGVPLVAAPLENTPHTETEIVRQLASADAKRFAEILRNWVK